ncbi:hypothetical protein L596_003459 [Steinernema carpocapsae]|uniref:Uncharacterized protein n=1 Tax=Steinernema carpocapsae TaxID=34508 RepID=A0A4U8UWM9_STECR|nr:hypothetical protein L596_003459 [Steinernema carpocapsae]
MERSVAKELNLASPTVQIYYTCEERREVPAQSFVSASHSTAVCGRKSVNVQSVRKGVVPDLTDFVSAPVLHSIFSRFSDSYLTLDETLNLSPSHSRESVACPTITTLVIKPISCNLFSLFLMACIIRSQKRSKTVNFNKRS